MNFLDFELAFARAFSHAFSLKKMSIVFPFFVLAGAFSTFCRALSFQVGKWLSLSLFFVPLLLFSGLFLALGIVLIRMYYHDVKNLPYDAKKILEVSWELIIVSAYVSIPVILLYLGLWVLLGVFFALGEMPGIGKQLESLFAFAPFLLNFVSIVLLLGSFTALFFGAPVLATNKHVKKERLRLFLQKCFTHMFRMIVCLFVALLPMLAILSMLFFAAHLSEFSAGVETYGLTYLISSFFLMIPISFLLTPFTIFFFNFSAESHQLLYVKTS